MRSLLLAYLVVQVALSPGFLLSLRATPRRAGLRFAWTWHRLLVVAALVAPLVCLFSLRSVVPTATFPFARAGGGASAVQSEPAGARLAANDSGPAMPAPAWSGDVGHALSAVCDVLGVLSAAGAAAFLARLGVQRGRERRMRRSGRTRRFGRLAVVFSPLVEVPFSTGVLAPRVYLPSSVAGSARALCMVLAHEGAHLRRLHSAWTLAEAVLAAAFWYNPLLVAVCVRGRRVRELVCDQAVIRSHPPMEYGRLLLRAALRATALPRLLGLADGWLGRGALAERVRFLFDGGARASQPGTRVLAGLAGVVAGAVMLAALPSLAPLAAGGAPERPAEVATGDAFPMVCLMPVLSGESEVAIIDHSRMVSRELYNLVSLDFHVEAEAAEVVAATAGRVVEVRRETRGSWALILRSDSGFVVLYGNLSSVRVQAGERIAAGERLGTAGPAAIPHTGQITTSRLYVLDGPGVLLVTSGPVDGTISVSGSVTIRTPGYSRDSGVKDLAGPRSITASDGVLAVTYAADAPQSLLHFEVDLRGHYIESLTLKPPRGSTGAAAHRFVVLQWGPKGAE